MQSDAGACDAGGVAAAKIALEQPHAVARRNADAVIAHLHHQPSRFLARPDLGRARSRGILDGVGDEIAERVKQQLRIAMNGRGQRLEVLDDDGAAVRIAVGLTGIAQQRGRIEVAGMKCGSAIEDPRGAEQAVHDVGDALHGAADAGAALGAQSAGSRRSCILMSRCA